MSGYVLPENLSDLPEYKEYKTEMMPNGDLVQAQTRILELEAGLEQILDTKKGEQDICWNIAADLLGKPRIEVAYVTLPKR